MCVQNVFITIANQIRIRIMNKVLLLKNTFEKNAKLGYDSPRTSFGRQYDVFCFLGKTLMMTPFVQIKSLLNDFRLFLLYNRTLFQSLFNLMQATTSF